jgi:hypothetical protein
MQVRSRSFCAGLIALDEITGSRYDDITGSADSSASGDITSFASCDIAGSTAMVVASTAAASTPIIACAGADITSSTDIAGSSSDDVTGSGSANISASSDITGSSGITRSAADDTDSSASGCAGSAGSTAERQATQPWNPAEWRVHCDEKTAIGEYDHGMSRQQAEALAFEFSISKWLYQHPMSSNADDGCLVCNEPDRPGDPLLAIGLAGGLACVHHRCSKAWRAGRIAAAIAALDSTA